MDYKQILDKHGLTSALASALEEMIEGAIDVDIVVGDDGKLPTLATDGSAGYDLYTAEDVDIKDRRFKVSLDIRFSLPKGFAAIIKPRSGFTLKGMEVIDERGNKKRIDAWVNDGVIDSDYRGIVNVMMESTVAYHNLPKGTKVAQMLIVRTRKVNWHKVPSLDNTDRGEGGFGHTGE